MALLQKIGNQLNSLIPIKWSKILLYTEIQPGVVSYYYCFHKLDNRELVQYEDIVRKYEVNRNKRILMESELTELITKLNDEFANNNQERWTTMTFILQNDGKFIIDYGYEDLNNTSEITRRKTWKKKYLNI
jgi:hypothetical protein